MKKNNSEQCFPVKQHILSAYWDSLPVCALLHIMQFTVMLLCSLLTCLLQVQQVDLTLPSLDMGQRSHLLAIVCEDCELVDGVTFIGSGKNIAVPFMSVLGSRLLYSLLFKQSCNRPGKTLFVNFRRLTLFSGLHTYNT